MSRRVVFVVPALLLGGCDLLFQVDEVHGTADATDWADAAHADPAADAATNCTVERFDALPSQWRTYAKSPMASVAIDGTLAITLIKATDAHGGTESILRDYTGMSIEVEIVSTPDPASEMYMDWENGNDWYGISIDHGQISYGLSVGNNESTIEIPYVPEKHRALRLTHEPHGDLVHMFTRDSAGVWSLLGTVPAGIPMTSLSVELAAGSYTSEVVNGLARFDNFATCQP